MIDFKNHEKGFRHKRMTLPIQSLLDWVMQHRIVVNPMFTYHRSWGRHVKVQFIESIFLGMPVPDFWCEENNYGELSVLDGSQYLECLIEFVQDRFKLQDMKILHDLEGCTYTELPFHYSSSFLGRTDIELRIISYDTDPLLKYEFFKGMNKDAYGFSVQAARNYAFSYLPGFLTELRESNNGFVGFDANERDYSRSSFKLAFNVDEIYLLLISLVLLNHRAISENVRVGVADLLDSGMLFLNENTWCLSNLAAEVKKNFEFIHSEIGLSLHVASSGLSSYSRVDSGRVLKGWAEVSVDGLVYAFVRALNGRRIHIDVLMNPPRYLRGRTINAICADLFGDRNA